MKERLMSTLAENLMNAHCLYFLDSEYLATHWSFTE